VITRTHSACRGHARRGYRPAEHDLLEHVPLCASRRRTNCIERHLAFPRELEVRPSVVVDAFESGVASAVQVAGMLAGIVAMIGYTRPGHVVVLVPGSGA